MPEEEVKSTIEELTPPKANNPTANPETQKATAPKSNPAPQNPKPSLFKPAPKKETTSQNKIEEEKPMANQMPNNPTRIQMIKYKFVGGDSIFQAIAKSVPKQLIPTERMSTILGVIFLLVLVMALLQFPLNRLLSGDINVVVKIGWPLVFLELGVVNPGETPLILKNVFLDLILYTLIAYIIDVLINVILSSSIFKTKDEKEQKLKTYKDLDPSISDKITRKIFRTKEEAIKKD